MKKLKLNILEKNFLYNLILTLLICGLIFSYMAFYMPQVYMEKKMARTEESAIKIHESFMRNKNYDDLEELPKEGMYSIFIPYGQNKVTIAGLRGTTQLEIKNQNLLNLFRFFEKGSLSHLDEEMFMTYIDPIKDDLKGELNKFATAQFQENNEKKTMDTISYKKINTSLEIKFESKTKDAVATNLVLISKNNEGTFILIYPFIFNNIQDIKSTVFAAFPVIFLLVVIIVFLLNRFYTKSLTAPILRMSEFIRKSKNEKNAVYDLEIHTNDEIEDLSNNLKELYETLTENYNHLENAAKRRDIFIKSTSHELKTPLQTAILLNESMIHKIGDYKDTDKYLPELREKLYKIQVLIDDLLYMNRMDQSPTLEDLDLSLIMKESIDNHLDLISQKHLEVKVEGEKIAHVDYDHFRIIFDNLIKNAIENTEDHGMIHCYFNENILIVNAPTHMDVEDLESLFDPFVSGKNKKSNGMGLYIAKTLLEDMGYDIILSYTSGEFVATIVKREKQR